MSNYSQGDSNSFHESSSFHGIHGLKTPKNSKDHKSKLRSQDVHSENDISALVPRDSMTFQNENSIDGLGPFIPGNLTSPSLVGRAPTLAIQLPDLPATFPKRTPIVRSRFSRPFGNTIWVGRNGKDNWGNTFPFVSRDICVANLLGQGAMFIRGEKRKMPYVIAARFELTNELTVTKAMEAAAATDLVEEVNVYLPYATSIWGDLETFEAYCEVFRERITDALPVPLALISTLDYRYEARDKDPMAWDQYYDFKNKRVLEIREKVEFIAPSGS